LLCDEPTSGLDSSTALRIVQMLKKECEENNMTIIATIHQPSSEVFYLFNRLLLLQEGSLIYQGPLSGIQSYVEGHLGCKLKKFSNPSDFLIKMAQQPQLCSKDLTFNKMKTKYD